MKIKHLLFLILFYLSVFTLYSQTVNDFEYEENNGKITITKYFGTTNDVTIPERINRLPVVAIGNNVFINSNINTITLPNTITHIGNNAFSDNQLRSINLPNSITNIGDGAFYRNQLI